MADRVDLDDAERTRRDAVAATVAGVRLDHDRVELGPDDGCGGAHCEAAGLDEVPADVAQHQPLALGPVPLELLDELDVPPVDAVQLAGVVVAVTRELVGAALVRRELVPLLAGDLARLTTDTQCRVGEKADGLARPEGDR